MDYEGANQGEEGDGDDWRRSMGGVRVRGRVAGVRDFGTLKRDNVVAIRLRENDKQATIGSQIKQTIAEGAQ